MSKKVSNPGPPKGVVKPTPPPAPPLFHIEERRMDPTIEVIKDIYFSMPEESENLDWIYAEYIKAAKSLRPTIINAEETIIKSIDVIHNYYGANLIIKGAKIEGEIKC